jgi:hypothetical protein
MNCKAMACARLNANRPMGCDRVANPGLRAGRRDHCRIAKCPGGDHQRLEARSVNSIVVAHQELHQPTLIGNGDPENEIRCPGFFTARRKISDCCNRLAEGDY